MWFRIEIHSIGGASNVPAYCLPLWVKKCQAKAAEENELWLSLQFVWSITGVASCNSKPHQPHSSDTGSHFSGVFSTTSAWKPSGVPHKCTIELGNMIFWKKNQNLGFLGCLHVFTQTFSDKPNLTPAFLLPMFLPAAPGPRGPRTSPSLRLCSAQPPGAVPASFATVPAVPASASAWAVALGPLVGRKVLRSSRSRASVKAAESESAAGRQHFGLAGLGDSGEKSLGAQVLSCF